MEAQTQAQWQEADLLAWQDAVARFVRQAVAPRCTQSEQALSLSSARELINGLIDLGVLNLGAEPAGGLWDQDDDPMQRRLAVSILQALAAQSAGLAYQVHSQALASRLDRWAGVSGPGPVLVGLQGSLGLGRDAVVQALRGQTLSGAQRALMADNWGWPTPSQPRYLHALPDWQAVWLPVWVESGGWQWHRLARDAMRVSASTASHGLDDLGTQAVWLDPIQGASTRCRPATWQGASAQQAWAALQAMHAVGLQAMTQAIVDRAWQQAQDYASLRRQGGQTIVGHLAVQQLLGRARSAVCESDQVLTQIGSATCRWPDLITRWRDRARCQTSLSNGASAALQVFGGMGYMRDNAMERALRDVNHLRLLGGSPAELALCVHHADAFATLSHDGATA
ncbi:MAG: acyl-CoA dehydrogenase family protein [Acidobacteriota bacterium]